MIWVLLWLALLFGSLYWFFGRRLRWVVLYLVALIGLVALIIAGGLLQEVLVAGGFGSALEAMSWIGWFVLIGAVTILVVAMSAMTIYAIRHGESDDAADTVVTENRPLSMSLGYPPLIGRSRRKILGSSHRLITDKSLVDGTATFPERMMVVGIIAAYTSFFLVFVGAALILMKTNLFFILLVTIPGLFFYRFASSAWREYQRAKRKFSARGH